MEVTVTVNRGTTENPDAKSYQLKESGKSKKGTFKTFSPVGDNADLPAFGKVYIKAKRDKSNKKS